MPLQLEIIPDKAVVVRRDKTIVAASWSGPGVLRPYIYPFLGPDDREVTRLGHPNDPVGHSHHRSIWIGHHDVSGVNFWEDSASAGRIQQTGAVLRVKEGAEVSAEIECDWRAADGRLILLEKRKLAFIDTGRGGLGLEIDLELRPGSREKDAEVTLGDTPFGLLGIRVARTMRVAEGLGGLILNSQDAEDEKGCFWQHAEWCDSSGPVPLSGDVKDRRDLDQIPAGIVGICCFDHPENHPGDTIWHVRDDGWMGPCISRGEPRKITASSPLRARWRIESHAGRPWHAQVGERYRQWRGK